MKCDLRVGDCRAVLPTLPDESVNCIVTSPPYFGLRDYGVDGQIGLEKTPDAYVAELVAVFREARRVLRDDGTFWLNIGDSYASSSNTGGTKSIQGSAKRIGAMTDRKHGIPEGLKPKDLIGVPWRVAFALQEDSWYLRQDIIWAKPNPMPESVTDRCTKAHEYLFLLTKSERYWFDADAIAEAATPCEKVVTAKSSSYAQAISNGKKPTGNAVLGSIIKTGDTRNRRSVWTIPTQPCKLAHFAVMPEKLVEPCILAGCPDGGTVLDPFGGSGTVGLVAERLGRNSVLIELNEKYVALQRERTAQIGMALAEGKAGE